jgi:Leucine-rich repeat (LRR) protein/Flp pilus assembly protein TadD
MNKQTSIWIAARFACLLTAIPLLCGFTAKPQNEQAVLAPKTITEKAMACLSAGNQSEAETLLENALRQNPNDQSMLFLYAACVRSRFSVRDSLALFSAVAQMGTNSVSGQCALHLLFLDTGRDKPQHFAELKKLVENNPGNVILRWMLAVQCRAATKKTTNLAVSYLGAEQYKKILEVWNPGPVLIHQTYANILTDDLERYDEALVHRKIAVSMEPRAWSYEGLGVTLRAMQRYEESSAAFQKCVELAPKDSDYWIKWAYTLRLWGKTEEALEKYIKASECDPSEALAFRGIGICLVTLNRQEEAVAAYTKAAALGSNDAIAYLAKLNGGKGTNITATLQEIEYRAMEGDVKAMITAARMYKSGQGTATNFTQAAAWYEVAAQRGNPEAMAQLGQLYETGLGVPCNLDKALELYRTAATNNDEIAMHRLSLMYAEGKGVPKNEEEAKQWAQAAYNHGYRPAVRYTGTWSSSPTPNTMKLTSLEGLKSYTVVNLDLRGCPIRDWSPLSGLTNLQSLTLSDNQLTNLPPLQKLTKLSTLFLDNNAITNIAPLSNLKGLQRLFLSRNRIADLSPLAGLTNLTTLYCESNMIEDITPLAGLTNLQTLRLDRNQVQNLTALTGLSNLKGLYLGHNKISSLSAIQNLTRLTALDITQNEISDISALAGLKRLTIFMGYNNQIADLTPLIGLKKLTTMSLFSNKIRDLSPLIANASQGGIGEGTSLFLMDNPLGDTNQVNVLRDQYQLKIQWQKTNEKKQTKRKNNAQ